MKRNLIIGDSGGIGSAVADALRASGQDVVGLSRRRDGLDITDENSIKTALAQLDGSFDLVLVATGALVVSGQCPEKSIKSLTPDGLLDQFRVNAVGPAMILKHALPLLPRDRRCVFAALSARVGSIGDNGLGGWYSYRTAKTAMNQLVHSAAIELSRTHKNAICVCLHPGTVETALTAKYANRHKTVPASQAAKNLLGVIDGLTPADTGGFYDYAGKMILW